MKRTGPPDAAEDRRRADRVRATEVLQQQQEAKIYGAVTFQLQSGRIVRIEIKTTEKLGA